MTTPQGPWQHGGGQQHPQGNHVPHATPAGGYPQAGYPPNPYAAPPVPGNEGTPLTPPTSVTIAFWIAIVVPVLATVLIAVGMLMVQGMANEVIDASLAEGGIEAGTREAEQAAQIGGSIMTAMFALIVVLYVVLTGLWILFGFKMRAGRNWARVTLTIFAALWLFNGVAGLIGGSAGLAATATGLPEGVALPGGYAVLGYVQSGVSVLAMGTFIALLYLKPSNWFFQAADHRR